MVDPRSADAPVDLAWSLWTELGLPGPRRDHPGTVVDPERLLVVTPWFARADARLLDLVMAWCVQHGARLSTSRLAALVRAADPDVRSSAEVFLAELAAAGVRLAGGQPSLAAQPRSIRKMVIDCERTALLRFRARSLVGVGGRADLLVALLSTPDVWVTASSLVDEVGLAKRHIARILAELAEGRVVHARPRGNVREFRLTNPGALSEVLGVGEEAVFPPWGAVFAWMRLADELAGLEADRPSTFRVEVARRKDTLLSLAIELGFPLPDAAETNKAAAMVAWVGAHARALADGTAGPVGGPSRAGRSRLSGV